LRSYSLRKRLIIIATLVLVIALGLVGVALNSANYRGAVSALETRMESYVYQVLAAMEVEPSGQLVVEEDFTDPRLLQPASGLYIRIQGDKEQWNSRSSLGVQLPGLEMAEAGAVHFVEPAGDNRFFTFQYGVGWQLENESIQPFTVSVLVDAGEIEQQTSAFRLGLWQSLGTAAVILVLAQVLIMVLVFRPLGQVARDVARIESGRSPRLDGQYPRELEPLARNVNRLLETEKSNQGRIRNALDSLAHSLKTPLAVIQAGLPLHGDPAGSMQNAVDEMSRLIATRLERAGSTARRTLAEPLPVQPQLQRLVESLKKVYTAKKVEAEIDLEDDLAFYGENRDLMELLGNLLDNAYKYGHHRVRISGGAIHADTTRPGLWLQIEDDGAGIEETQWAKLLQRGARGDERVEGHGLGLAIVTELVAAYGGEISIGHSELGGAKIRVELPAS
jgi:two-component system sensor histidine kinase PhoQ